MSPAPHLDPLGNPVSPGEPATLAAIDAFVRGFLGYRPEIADILAAAEAEPTHALAQAYAGLLHLLSETGSIPEPARIAHARADAARTTATPREACAIDALSAWLAGDIPACQAACRRALALAPRDLAMLKLHQYHDFNRGQFLSMLRAALDVADANTDQPAWWGMAAFAYEQCHLMDDAERAARHALSLDPAEPWAQHALAHCLLTTGRIDDGIAFLEAASPGWASLTSFMDTHHWWHLALFYIARGRFADALAAYDHHAWARERTFSQDQIGAVSLLARLECAGIDVTPRWDDLGTHLAARATDTDQPFLSLQYLYGLARARRPEAHTLLAAITRRAETAPADLHTAWAEITLPAARALFAHATGDHATTVTLLGPALARLDTIGGSHAQRDLFEQLFLDALLQAGHDSRAQQILEHRRQSDPTDVPINRALAALYTRAALPGPAAAAVARVTQGLRPCTPAGGSAPCTRDQSSP
ncbi:tetratricopeptide (TPR) repeat protein [Endobacter medicaginis]|uniref:Tetratricopeptide repeat protein 38 n=5 Tax=Endobacter medicaginis TaxID=1181271 RepID=A0A839UX16_9PROT|nr:tetratricopeptide (TPR) repeat protein [Endobacter medicaginis]